MGKGCLVVGGFLLVIAACALLAWTVLTYTGTPVPGGLTPSPTVSVSPGTATSTPAPASHR